MTQNTTLSVSILSGKGGVGKTNIALNLGYCLYRGGHPLLLMDCDLGLANLDVLLGIAPDRNMQDLLDSDAAPRDIAVPIEQGGFDFLPAASEPTSLTDSYALMKVLSTQHGVRDFFVIVNQAESRKEETQTFERLAAACRKFLDIEPQFLGGVRLDKALPDAVRKQKPLMRVAPQSPAAQDLFSIAVKLQRMRSALLPELADKHPLRALAEEPY